ncbi:hypothetical protein TNCV_3217761 [Trichonephila clavipes]|nr:hypothetical protein TNCV_3217761 [Trichonephila clavipes]
MYIHKLDSVAIEVSSRPKLTGIVRGFTCFAQTSDRLPRLTQTTILDRVLGAHAAGAHYRLFSVWTLVPVRLGKQLSDNSTVDEIASEAADCRLTYTMANCPQRR